MSSGAAPARELREPRAGAARRSAARVASLIRKEFRQLLRDRANLALGILMPIVMILLFGYGVSLDLRNAPVAVVGEDRSPEVADVLAGLRLSPYLAALSVGSMPEATALMQRHEVDAILRVPGNFAADLGAGKGELQLLLQGVDAQQARMVQSYVGGAIAQWSLVTADRQGGIAAPEAAAVGTVALVPRFWFNAANTSTWYLVPGLIVLVLTVVGAFLTSLVVAREWERGTLEALFVTPVRPTEILIAKLVPYFVVGMIGFAMCVVAARVLFEVPLQGSLALLVLAAVLYMLVALGLGLLISSVTKSQFLASQAALLISFLPALMLSGFLFDLHNVPLAVRIVGQALPATYFMELIKTLFLAGNVWPLVLKDCAILAAYAVGLLIAARLATTKRLA